MQNPSISNIIKTFNSLRDLPMYLRSMAQLVSFKNKHTGDRCFIIGNGPSLKQMDLSLLKNEITFGLNRGYLLFPRIGFSTTFLVVINRYVMEQFGDEFVDLVPVKFLNWYYRKSTFPQKDIIYIRPGIKSRFSTNPVIKPVWEGATVTYIAMQLAYYMGFSKVILIGVDHSFGTKGLPNQLVVSNGNDPNHFDQNYFGKGVKWQLPDLETSGSAYSMAKKYFEADGREIVDATMNGNLSIFRKIDYNQVF
jgi:hypothetical protein